MNKVNLISNIDTLDLLVMFTIFFITSFSIKKGLNRNIHQTPFSENSNTDRFFLKHIVMGRTLTLPLFVATLVASWYGGIFGVTEISFKTGIYCFITQGIFWYIAYIIFALFVVKTISKYSPYTFPDMIFHLFGKNSSKLASLFNLFNVLPIAYTLSLGVLIHTIFGINLYLSTFIGTLLVLSYTIRGGMLADVYSDLIHFIIMCSSVLLVVIFSYINIGPLSYLKETLPSHYFQIQSDQSISSMFMWFFIAMSTLVNPSFYQKCFATNNYRITRSGIFISIIIWMIFDCCTVLGGMYAKVFFDTFYQGSIESNPQSNIYLIMSLSILPSGLKGFFLSGILATIISTFDSNLLISSNTLCFDIISPNKRSIKFQRLSVIIVALISICMSFIFNGSVKEVWKTIGSLSSGSLTLPVLLGLIKPLILKDNQFITVVLSSFILMLLSSKFLQIEMIFVGIGSSAILSLFFIIKNKIKYKK